MLKIPTKIAAIIITIALFALLFSQIRLKDLADILTRTNPIYILLGFIVYMASYLLRALRLHILMDKQISVKELFSIVCVHFMALNILPARSGELSYIYLLSKRHKRTTGEGAASLITIRIMDIITISLFFLISMILVNDLPGIVMKAARIIALFLGFTILFILVLILNYKRSVKLLRKISVYLNIDAKNYVKYMFEKLDEISEAFKKLTTVNFIYALSISIFIWIMLYTVLFVLIKAMNIDIEPEPFLLASTFFLMTSILPIQGIAGFGTTEGGWAVSFMAVGMQKEAAISSGFVIHIISIIYIGLLFMIGFKGLKEKQISDK